MTDSLYIHIPFCNNICGYCDFTKVLYKEEWTVQYINLLIKDIEKLGKFKTVYIGGGSPSSLSSTLLDLLLKSLVPHLKEDYEFTIEVNPEDMDEEKVSILSRNKINRVSIGVQTFNEELLKTLNRRHNNSQVFKLINDLQNVGITNISCDLMFGLPNQTKEDIKQDIKTFISLHIPHISTYALLVEDNTTFKVKNIEALDEDIQADYYSLINKLLKKHGYTRYEVSNFAKKGYESKHNLIYWHGKEYVGLGVGASGYENSIRYDNTRSLSKYLNGINEKEEISISEEEKEYEYIILHLRLKEGISLKEYYDKYQISFLVKYENEINELLEKKLIKIKKGHLFVKEDKMFVLNQILSVFSI